MELKNMDGINVSPKNIAEIRQNSLIIATMVAAGYPGAEVLVKNASVIEAYILKDVNVDALDEGNNLQDLLASVMSIASMFIDQEDKETPAPEQESVAYETATGIQAAETEAAEKPKKTK